MSKEYIEREKVIEVIKNYGKNAIDIGQSSLDPANDIILLQGAVNMIPAADVIVPPCKVGDTVYFPWMYDGTSGIAILEISSICLFRQNINLIFYDDVKSDMPMPSAFFFDDFGETVFLTKEEAEAKLEG